MALVSTGVLAACSSGYGGGGGGGDNDLSYGDLRVLSVEISGDTPPTQSGAGDLPPGTAKYEGIGAFDTVQAEATGNNPDILAQATLTADFGGSTITDSLHDFQASDGRDIDQDLEMSGTIGNDGIINIDLGGTLEIDSDTATYANGAITGGFFGPTGGFINATGQVTQTLNGIDTDLYGIIVARQE